MDKRDDRWHADAREALRKCHLFAALDDEQFERILACTRQASLGENAILFERQQEAKEIFLLHSGQVKLALISTEGHEKVVDLISPGASFAEAIMFSGTPVYPVTAVAVVPSRVWCVDAGIYGDILQQSTRACFAVMAQMSRRLHWQLAEIDRLALHNAAFRVVNYLLDQLPSTHLSSAVIRLDTPKHVIASRLSVTPETLSRTFARLARDGYLEIRENSITIDNLEKLRTFGRSDSL